MILKKLFLFLLILISFISITYSYTNITSCQTISSAGEYRQNVSIISNDTSCIVINSDDVLYNGQKYNITGNQSLTTYGIHINGSNNVSINNSNVYNYTEGIYSYRSNSSVITNVISQNHTNRGIRLFGPLENSSISDSNLSSSSTNNLYFYYVDHSNVTNVNSEGRPNTGFLLEFSNNNIFDNLFINDSLVIGFEIAINSHNNTLRNSVISNNIRAFKFYTYGPTVTNNTIYDNDFRSNTLSIFYSGDMNDMQNNTFYGNYLMNSSRIDNLTGNNFNYTHPTYGNIGNYYNDLNCVMPNFVQRGPYFVCTNPENYTVNSTPINIYDNAPLVYPENISSCPYTISTSGFYELDKNIGTDGTCITISTNYVYINCKGYTINDTNPDAGSDGMGIYSTLNDNLQVNNCAFRNEGVSISFDNGENITIHSNNFYNLTEDDTNIYGVYLSSITNASIYNNTVSETVSNVSSETYGFYPTLSTNISIYNNSISTTYIGIRALSTNNLSIFNNHFFNFNKSAISFHGGLSNTRIYNNTIHSIYSANGFDVANPNNYGSNNSIFNNNIYNILGDGMFISSSRNIDIYSNNFTNISDEGMALVSSTNFSIYSNIFDNISDIVFDLFSDVSNVSIFSNTVQNSDYDNYAVRFRTSTTVNNTVHSNTFLGNGIEIDADATGNIIYANFLSNRSQMLIVNPNNYFNFTHSTYGNIGNYYNNLTCFETITRGPYEVCTNPSSYLVNLSFYDYAPLTLGPILYVYETPYDKSKLTKSSINFKVINVPGQYSSCTLSINGASLSMDMSGSVCTYSYNISSITQTDFIFNVSLGPTNDYLPTRTFTYYLDTKNVAELPMYSNFSMFIGIFFLLIFFWRNKE